MTASEEGEEEGTLDEEMPNAPTQAKSEPTENEQSLIREAPIGKGEQTVTQMLQQQLWHCCSICTASMKDMPCTGSCSVMQPLLVLHPS